MDDARVSEYWDSNRGYKSDVKMLKEALLVQIIQLGKTFFRIWVWDVSIARIEAGLLQALVKGVFVVAR
jgi:hypothetical protein